MAHGTHAGRPNYAASCGREAACSPQTLHTHTQHFPQHTETVFSSHQSSNKASALPGEQDVAVLSSPAVYDRELLDFVSGAQRVVDSIFLLQKNRGEKKKHGEKPRRRHLVLSAHTNAIHSGPPLIRSVTTGYG